MKTKSLCRRHNTALSPIDAEAGRLARGLVYALTVLDDLTAVVDRPMHIFNGQDIERWLLKTLISMYRYGAPNAASKSYRLPTYLSQLFFDLNWPVGCGLYFKTREVNSNDLAMQIGPEHTAILLTSGSFIVGVTVTLLGIAFTLGVASDVAHAAALGTNFVYRPQFINFYRGQRVVCLNFAWPVEQQRTVWMSYGDSNAPTPTNPADP